MRIRISVMVSVIYYIFLFIFTTFYLVFFCLLFLITRPFDKEGNIIHKASRFWSMTVFRMCPGWKLITQGLDKIEPGKAYMVVANHQSMADIPLLYALPLRFKWVSKKEVLKWPVFGMVLKMHGDIIIERGKTSSTLKMMEQTSYWLSRGISVIIFPEGTRSKDGKVGRFREGAFMAAKHAGVGILPVATKGTGNLSDGWKIRRPHRLIVKVLEPVSAETVMAEDPKTTAAKVGEMIRNEVENL